MTPSILKTGEDLKLTIHRFIPTAGKRVSDDGMGPLGGMQISELWSGVYRVDAQDGTTLVYDSREMQIVIHSMMTLEAIRSRLHAWLVKSAKGCLRSHSEGFGVPSHPSGLWFDAWCVIGVAGAIHVDSLVPGERCRHPLGVEVELHLAEEHRKVFLVNGVEVYYDLRTREGSCREYPIPILTGFSGFRKL